MDWTETKVEIRNRVNIEQVFQAAGLAGSARAARDELLCQCPHCKDGGHCSVNAEQGVYHCFKCGEGGDLFTAYQTIHCCDFPAAVRDLAEMAGIEANRGTPANNSRRVESLLSGTLDYTPSPAELTALALQVARVSRRVLDLDPSRLGQVWELMEQTWQEAISDGPQMERLESLLEAMRDVWRQAQAASVGTGDAGRTSDGSSDSCQMNRREPSRFEG
jgi:hypothetical protein